MLNHEIFTSVHHRETGEMNCQISTLELPTNAWSGNYPTIRASGDVMAYANEFSALTTINGQRERVRLYPHSSMPINEQIHVA